jgi:transposase-like protein
MERRKFTREFKLEAVKLITERGVKVAQASQDLGVHPTQLRQWVKDFEGGPEPANTRSPAPSEMQHQRSFELMLFEKRTWLLPSPAVMRCAFAVHSASRASGNETNSIALSCR